MELTASLSWTSFELAVFFIWSALVWISTWRLWKRNDALYIASFLKANSWELSKIKATQAHYAQEPKYFKNNNKKTLDSPAIAKTKHS